MTGVSHHQQTYWKALRSSQKEEPFGLGLSSMHSLQVIWGTWLLHWGVCSCYGLSIIYSYWTLFSHLIMLVDHRNSFVSFHLQNIRAFRGWMQITWWILFLMLPQSSIVGGASHPVAKFIKWSGGSNRPKGFLNVPPNIVFIFTSLFHLFTSDIDMRSALCYSPCTLCEFCSISVK